MNKRIRKKKDKKLVLSLVEQFRNQKEMNMCPDKEEWSEIRQMLLKVCRKAVIDRFPLKNYFLYELPYEDNEGWIIMFAHREDYDNFHNRNMENRIRGLDFWCSYAQKLAIPLYLTPKGEKKYADSCFKAVYFDDEV